ncbi:hypothetical protein HNQ02_003153 [Flavobacterium sp. 7E]|uniref:hypothetical protein n=1 Tax=unclassified Flavobacterium TaxID=196869 RepID=UPI0015707C80|nr:MULTISPECIES: hypothetical protein [unclassified Flavobacterium]MBE0392210.1 hypothetical protein [Flavobacterium sp. PL002]NRS90216.1 hypothetical protein [Flavobacterium sp. 7E]
MKKYFIILISILFISCASFGDEKSKFQKINISNVTTLNGNYSVFAIKKSNKSYPYFDNANEKFYRKYGRDKSDTIKFDTINGGDFKILVKNEKEINLEFIANNKILKSQTLKYKIKDDGFLHIKNKNTLIWGIPYLFGGVDVRKVRIALSENNDLIINDVFDSSGAFLLIFGDAKVWERTNKYKRL